MSAHRADRQVAATCTYVLQFPNGEFIVDPTNWMRTTRDIGEAHLWLWPIDESTEARDARIQDVKKRMKYPPDGRVTAVRAR